MMIMIIIVIAINAAASDLNPTYTTQNQMPKAVISSVYIGPTPLHTQYDMQDLFKTIYWSPPPPSLALPSPKISTFSSRSRWCIFYLYPLFSFFLFFLFFFLVFSLCMQILSDLSELCVSVREPLWFGVTEDCTHGDCIHWAYSEPCISNWDVSMCSHIPTTKL